MLPYQAMSMRPSSPAVTQGMTLVLVCVPWQTKCLHGTLTVVGFDHVLPLSVDEDVVLVGRRIVSRTYNVIAHDALVARDSIVWTELEPGGLRSRQAWQRRGD